MTTEIPQRWSQLMVKAGAVNPRNGNPSLTQLAKMAGHHTSTVSKLILQRDHTVSRDIRRTVAEALGIDPGELDTWVGEQPAEEYKGPPGAERLTSRERRAIDEIIRVLLDARINSEFTGTVEKTNVAAFPGPRQKTPPKAVNPRRHAARVTSEDKRNGDTPRK